MIATPGRIIHRPVLTEKGTAMTDDSATYLFDVAMNANKVQIRQALEKLYDIKVESVRTQVVRGKRKRVGQSVGMRKNWKKAIVKLAKGSDIDFFSAQV